MRLTQLVGVSQARGCIRRASAQHRLRGAKQERSTYRVRHVTKAAYTLHLTAYSVLRIDFAIICQWLFSRLFPHRSDTLQLMRCTGGKHSHWHIISKSIRNTRAAMHTRLVYSVNRIVSLLMYCTVHQGFSTYGTCAICGTLTKNFWHFAFIFMWHSWSNNIKKMALRKKKVERTVVHYWLVTTHYSFVQVSSNLDENLSWKYHKIYK